MLAMESGRHKTLEAIGVTFLFMQQNQTLAKIKVFIIHCCVVRQSVIVLTFFFALPNQRFLVFSCLSTVIVTKATPFLYVNAL